jgi:hypothetical protein
VIGVLHRWPAFDGELVAVCATASRHAFIQMLQARKLVGDGVHLTRARSIRGAFGSRHVGAASNYLSRR